MLRLERDTWSMVKLLRQTTNEYAFPPPAVEGAPLEAPPKGPPQAPPEYPAEGAVGGKNYARWLLVARKKYDKDGLV